MIDPKLRKIVAAAIFDPGKTEGYKGDRTLTEWQTDAVMRALYASLPASGAVEAGWQLVPKEPTPEMVSAAMGEIPEDGSEYDDIEDAWRAMLAAAPTEGR